MNTEPTTAGAGNNLILVETGGDRLKMMRTVPGRNGVAVANLHVERVAAAAPESEALANAMARVLKTWPDVARTPAILCLPRQSVTIRNLELPSTDPDEIDAMIAIQTDKLTPWSRDEVLYDYSLLKSSKPGYSRAMLVIAQRSALRQRFHQAETAGLDPERLTISSEGLLMHAARPDDNDQSDTAFAALDVDSFYSDCMVIQAGQLLFSRSILAGADDLAANPDAAAEKIGREVAQSIELANRETEGQTPAQIIVSGAPQQAETLAGVIQAKTGLPCRKASPDPRIRIDPQAASGINAAELETVSLTALSAMALAPERLQINLLPESVRMRRELGRRARIYSLAGMAVMSLLLAASLFAHIRFLTRRQELRSIRQQVLQTAPQAEKIARRLAIAQQADHYLNPQTAAASLLAAVHQGMPPDVNIEGFELDVEQKRLIITGNAPAMRDVRTLVNQIEALPQFRGAREDGAMSQDARSGRFKFKVLCPLDIEP